MEEWLENISDTMFFHTLSKVFGKDKIQDYLIDKDFDVCNVCSCTNVDSLTFLDALVYSQQRRAP